MFLERRSELSALNDLYQQPGFQMFVLYGRRRVGKTALLARFCADKDSIFFSADLAAPERNLHSLTEIVLRHYHYDSPGSLSFSSWLDLLTWIHQQQGDRRIIVVLDEFPYLAGTDRGALSGLQHLIDHTLQHSPMFLILCGSYMGFMEKEVLSYQSPLYGRRTSQLRLKPMFYRESLAFLEGFSLEEQLMLYGALGGTPLYLNLVRQDRSPAENLQALFLTPTSLLYEEPLMLLREDLREPAFYNTVLEAIACGSVKSGEIATKCYLTSAKVLKYIGVLIRLGIVEREVPFGEKATSRRSIYRLCDPMFRFWYRFVFPNRTLLDAGAAKNVWERRILPAYSDCMGLAFEQICREYLLLANAADQLPIFFSEIGRWWGTDPGTKSQVEIDLVAAEGDRYLFCECKWRNQPADLSVLSNLQRSADCFRKTRGESWFLLFSRSGFRSSLEQAAAEDPHILLRSLPDLVG